MTDILNNTLFIVFVVALVFGFAGAGVTLFIQRRKQNPDETTNAALLSLLTEMRPKLVALIQNVLTAYNKASEGYDVFETYIIDLIYDTVQDTEALSDAEKGLVTRELLIALLSPEMKELFEKKVIENK